MDTNELFWATGINNTGLITDQQEAIEIFKELSSTVGAALTRVTTKYNKIIEASKVKFGNPVEDGMISGIKTQIESLGKTIDMEIQKLGNFTAKYDQSMSKISKSAAKLQVGNNSPLAPMVAGIQKDVASASQSVSFLENRFKYMAGSMIAYGSVSVLKSMATEIIEVKTQFEFLQTAINSFAGSAEKGAKIMHELTQFAVNSPLQVNDITEAAKQLMAFGVGTDNVVGQIKMLSDVAAGAGKPIKEIAYIYGKSLTEGKVYTRTLMQFGNLGIPIYEALAKVMDTTPAKIKKMTQMGAVGFEDVKRAIESLTSAGGQYYGFSEKMMSTTAGLLSNVKDKWILAMKDMGESSDGFINGSVRLVDSAIANWEALGDAIAVAATAVGAYQVAKTVVGMGNNLKTTAFNIAETDSFYALMTAESQEAITKQGLVVGSAEYQAAIRTEIALQMEKATAAVVAAEKEVASATITATSSATTVSSLEAENAARLLTIQSTRASVVASGDNAVINEFNALVNKHNATILEIKTAAQIKNTAATTLGTMGDNLATATEIKLALATGVTTATIQAQTAGTNLLAAAHIRLIALMNSLKLTMMAHPYAAAFVVIATLVTIMWALHDSTTAAERAQKALGKAMDEIQARADKKSKMFSDNLDILKNPALKDTPQQIKALQVLHDVFGAVVGDLTKKQLIEMNSVELQNKVNKAMSYRVLLDKQAYAEEMRLSFLKERDTWSGRTDTGAMKKNLDDKRNLYLLAVKDANDYRHDYNAARTQSQIDDEVSNKTYWDNQLKAAQVYLDGMDSKEKAILNKEKPTKFRQIDKVSDDSISAYIKNMADKKEAEKELEAFADKSRDKASTRASDLRNREAADAAKRLEAIRANNTELANLKSKAETDATQATIDAMDAGYAKEKAQQENNFEKKLHSLDSEKATILKKEQENISNIFRNMNPNKSKTSTPSPTVTSVGEGEGGTTAAYNSLLSQATAGGMTKTATLIKESLDVAKSAEASYNSELDSARKDEDAKLGVLLEKQLLEYGDYTAKKAKIEKDYSLTLAALEKDRARESAKGNTEKVAQIDTAKIQAQTNQAKDQMALAFDQLKSTPEFAMAFEDLGNVSTATIEKLIGKMEELKTANSGALSLADYKVYAKELGKMTDEFIKRNPFKALKDSAEELKVAQDELNQAKAYQGLVKSGFKIGDNGMIAPVSGAEQTNKLASANTNVEKKTDDVTRAQNKGIKATKEITDAYGKLSKEMSSLGSSIGGIAGEIISSIGDIGSFVTTAITGWKTASDGATGALLVVEKASVILAVISAVITVATKVVAMFTDSSKKRAEEAQKEIDTINAVKNAWLEAHAAMTNKKFSNIFGDDVFGKATAQAGLMADAAKNFSRSMDIFQQGDRRVGGTVFDVIGRSVNVAIKDFDILKAKANLAGMDVKDASYASLKALIDSYESYQTYLDSVTSYLSSIFGQLGSNIMDSLYADQDNMTKWADDVTGYVTDSFSKMVKDIIYQIHFAKLLSDEQAKIQEILVDPETDSKEKEKRLQAEMLFLKNSIVAAGQATVADIKLFDKASTDAGMGTLGGTTTDNKNSTTSAIKGMDQPTADILTAQFSALRIHGANIDINTHEILLSLQGQTNILQIAFNDLSAIKKNTDRLEAIEASLNNMNTHGIKFLG